MGKSENRGEFLSRAPKGRVYKRQDARVVHKGQRSKTKRHSSVGIVLAVMLCCALLLSTVLIDEPFVQTMADGSSTSADGILGRLRFLGESVISAFAPEEKLASPVSGTVFAGFDTDTGYTEYITDAGSDVYAAADGTVVIAAFGDSGGRVEIAHTNGTSTVYELLSEPVVETGQKVKRGDALGASPSGRVRFSLLRDGVATDPGVLQNSAG